MSLDLLRSTIAAVQAEDKEKAVEAFSHFLKEAKEDASPGRLLLLYALDEELQIKKMYRTTLLEGKEAILRELPGLIRPFVVAMQRPRTDADPRRLGLLERCIEEYSQSAEADVCYAEALSQEGAREGDLPKLRAAFSRYKDWVGDVEKDPDVCRSRFNSLVRLVDTLSAQNEFGEVQAIMDANRGAAWVHFSGLGNEFTTLSLLYHSGSSILQGARKEAIAVETKLQNAVESQQLSLIQVISLFGSIITLLAFTYSTSLGSLAMKDKIALLVFGALCSLWLVNTIIAITSRKNRPALALALILSAVLPVFAYCVVSQLY